VKTSQRAKMGLTETCLFPVEREYNEKISRECNESAGLICYLLFHR